MLAKTVAALKSDFDVKMAAAFRTRVRREDGNDGKMEQNFSFSPAASVEDIKQLEDALTDETYNEKLVGLILIMHH